MSRSPWDWGNVDMGSMCDAMNFVMNEEHAERYERQIGMRRSPRHSRVARSS
ncbi:MAG: hypothetical protein U0W40_16055 [Acidimicrobiia bacterium]